MNEVFEVPGGEKKVLLHTCCAPCVGPLMERMMSSGINFTLFFYNPNIHPKQEYELRKNENIRFAEKHNIEFVDADYDPQNWFKRAKGLEPERGKNVALCVLICVLSVRLYTLMKMGLKSLVARLVFPDGKT